MNTIDDQKYERKIYLLFKIAVNLGLIPSSIVCTECGDSASYIGDDEMIDRYECENPKCRHVTAIEYVIAKEHRLLSNENEEVS